MRFIPTKKQWESWSLPSKASYFSAVFGVVTFFIGITIQLSNLYQNINIRDIILSDEIKFENIDKNFEPKIKIHESRIINYQFEKEADLAQYYIEKKLDPYRNKEDGSNEHVGFEYNTLPSRMYFSMKSCKDQYTKVTRNLEIIQTIWQMEINRNKNIKNEVLKNKLEYIYYAMNVSNEKIKEYINVIPVFLHYKNMMDSAFEEEYKKSLVRNIIQRDETQYSGVSEIYSIIGGERLLQHCLQVAGTISLEDWIVTFWIRRLDDGTYDLAEKAMKIFFNKYN